MEWALFTAHTTTILEGQAFLVIVPTFGRLLPLKYMRLSDLENTVLNR